MYQIVRVKLAQIRHQNKIRLISDFVGSDHLPFAKPFVPLAYNIKERHFYKTQATSNSLGNSFEPLILKKTLFNEFSFPKLN